jgi:hypothetical protein
MLKPSLLVPLLASLFASIAVGEESPAKRLVMTWVPPYAVDKCQARLNESFDGVGMKDGLTHLALQFWTPTKSGGVELVAKYGAIGAATVSAFRDWAHAHGVRVMLCVFNGVNSWDWPLAQAAFADHRKEFVDTLVAETSDWLSMASMSIWKATVRSTRRRMRLSSSCASYPTACTPRANKSPSIASPTNGMRRTKRGGRNYCHSSMA